jgi:hypothetical protein
MIGVARVKRHFHFSYAAPLAAPSGKSNLSALRECKWVVKLLLSML